MSCIGAMQTDSTVVNPDAGQAPALACRVIMTQLAWLRHDKWGKVVTENLPKPIGATWRRVRELAPSLRSIR